MKNFFKRAVFLLLFVSVALATTTGPKFPTSETGNTNTVGGGSVAWTNPGNIGASDGVFATATTGTSATTDDLVGTGFAFSITSTDTINGIQLEVNYKSAIASHNNEANVRLLKAGTAAGTDKSTGAVLPTSSATVSYGGVSDLWGTTWTPSDINNANFGAVTTYVGSASGGATISIDFFRITVTSTSGSQTRMFHVF